MLELYLYTHIILITLCVGSFLNVVIYRMPQGLSVVGGRSYCPQCNNQLKAYHLVPVLSYLALRGKCGFCKCRISSRYMWIELLTAVVSVSIFMIKGFTLEAVLMVLCSMVFICISVIDWEHMIIPDKLNMLLIPLALLLTFIQTDINFSQHLWGMVCVSVPMYVVCLFVEDAFGGGDIKLMAVCGLMLGWQNTFLALMVASVGAAVYCGMVMAKTGVRRGFHIPFGPFLCMGIGVAMLFGDEIIRMYLGLWGIPY